VWQAFLKNEFCYFKGACTKIYLTLRLNQNSATFSDVRTLRQYAALWIDFWARPFFQKLVRGSPEVLGHEWDGIRGRFSKIKYVKVRIATKSLRFGPHGFFGNVSTHFGRVIERIVFGTTSVFFLKALRHVENNYDK